MGKSIGLLFAGQGAQRVGMGKDLYQRFALAANRFAQADAKLGYSIAQVAFEGPIDELTKTSKCQVALYVHGISILDVLREQLKDFHFVATAGLSLGEFTAHAAAGSFDFLTGLQLVVNRSLYMEEACHAASGAMAAFIGGEESDIQQIAQEAKVDIANLNSPGQVVLSGDSQKIQEAIRIAKAYRVKRAVLLNVAGAFHSRLMASAAAKLRSDLAAVVLTTPQATVVANATARPAIDPDTIRRTLADQVTGTVRWTETVEYMIDQLGCDLFVELGPGEVVAGLVSRIRKGTDVISIGDLASFEKALPLLREALKA